MWLVRGGMKLTCSLKDTLVLTMALLQAPPPPPTSGIQQFASKSKGWVVSGVIHLHVHVFPDFIFN